MNGYLMLIAAFLIGAFLLDQLAALLNLRHATPAVPAEFQDSFDPVRYRRAQEYLRVNTRFDALSEALSLALTLAFIGLGGFEVVDRFARAFGLGPIGTGLVFAAALGLGASLLGLPVAVYRTFVIEARFGFNRTTVRTFVQDVLKGWLVAAVLGGALFALVLWIFAAAGALGWLVCWVAVAGFMLFVAYLAPVVLLPIFNRLTPLAPGELREALERYSGAQGFAHREIFVMDGSRRSAKSNAFFTGFGKSRRIVLYDTLIAQHPVEEIVAILAHEVGHYRRHHIPIHLALSLLTVGLVLWLASGFLANRGLFDAFSVSELSVYAGLVFFGFLYAPLQLLLGIAAAALSRHHEREADRFAVETTGRAEPLVAALKRLSRENLSNLTPHPLLVALHYSHPPVPERIRACRAAAAQPQEKVASIPRRN